MKVLFVSRKLQRKEPNMENINIFETENCEVKMPDLSGAEPDVWADTIVALLDTHKAQDIKVLKVYDQTIVADYFVLCTGTSNTQVKALAGEIEYKMGLAKVDYLRMEGYNEGSWIIVDYGSVLVHIFQRETRDFYNLEKLWSDSEDIDVSALLK